MSARKLTSSTGILTFTMPHTFDATPLVHMDTAGVTFDAAAAAGGGRKAMIQLALKLTVRTIESLKNLAASIKAGLTGNASFPTPSPSTTDIQTACDAVSAQEGVLQAAEDSVTHEREVLAQAVESLRGVLRAVGADCLDEVKNDAPDVALAKLLSANLPIKTEGSPADPVAVPQNFHVTQGDHTGSVDGGCNRVPDAKMYRTRVGTSPGGPFETKYEGTKSSWTITSLAVGECWFQMAAFGTNGGWSEWSDPARCHVI